MSIVSSSLRNLSTFVQDHQASFSSGLLILFTIGGEEIFKKNAFTCPSTHPQAMYYALVFMFVPAAILFIMCVVVSNLTWRIWHGCYKRSEDYKHGVGKASGRFVEVVARSAIVPCAWILVTLLDGSYYACLRSEDPSNKTSTEYANLKAESQSIGWGVLFLLVLITFIVVATVRCCDSVTYEQYKYIAFYREAEQQQLDEKGQEKAKEEAKKNVEKFIKDKNLSKEDWDAISVTPDRKLSSLDNPSLTPLHEWAKKKPPENPSHKPNDLQLQEQPTSV